jgi:hypothetical protein
MSGRAHLRCAFDVMRVPAVITVTVVGGGALLHSVEPLRHVLAHARHSERPSGIDGCIFVAPRYL